MLLEEPVGLSEAVKALLGRRIMPTALDTDGLRGLDALLRAQSFFSAQTLNADLLDRYKTLIGSILNPEQDMTQGQEGQPGEARPAYNPAYAREEIKNFLESISYVAPEGKEGTLQDLSSDQRINLVVETNRDMAQGQGAWIESQDPALLDQWPGQELFRAESRKVPRDWMARWRLAGGQTGDSIGTGWTITTDGRLIALKNHEIWDLIGSSSLFKDGLDQPWPPFAFQSGMWVRDVDHDEVVGLGLLDEGQSVKPANVLEVFQRQRERVEQLQEN